MFGYIRPEAPELRIREFERFRACYCGLCHELGRDYGFPGRFILNYDFVFLAMLLTKEESCEYCFNRCLPAFCRKRCVCASSEPLRVSAGYSVILTYWKLCDSVADSKGAKRLAARCGRLLLKRAYKKAAGEYPGFDGSVRRYLAELSELERAGTASIDQPADKFASLLACAADGEADAFVRRPLEQLLYHVGRIIYIADAVYDLEEDRKSGSYNPLIERFDLKAAGLPKDISDSILETLLSSQNLAAAAYALLPESYWSPVTENIIYLGIPAMCRQVVGGTYRTIKRGLPGRVSGAEWRK